MTNPDNPEAQYLSYLENEKFELIMETKYGSVDRFIETIEKNIYPLKEATTPEEIKALVKFHDFFQIDLTDSMMISLIGLQNFFLGRFYARFFIATNTRLSFTNIFSVLLGSSKDWLHKDQISLFMADADLDSHFYGKNALKDSVLYKNLYEYEKVFQTLDIIKLDGSAGMVIINKLTSFNAKSYKRLREDFENIHKKYPNMTLYLAVINPRGQKNAGLQDWVLKNYETNPRIKYVWGPKIFEVVTNDPDAYIKTNQAVCDYIQNKYEPVKSLIEDFKTSIQKLEENKEIIKILEDRINK